MAVVFGVHAFSCPTDRRSWGGIDAGKERSLKAARWSSPTGWLNREVRGERSARADAGSGSKDGHDHEHVGPRATEQEPDETARASCAELSAPLPAVPRLRRALLLPCADPPLSALVSELDRPVRALDDAGAALARVPSLCCQPDRH